jgi:hypothetical protein
MNDGVDIIDGSSDGSMDSHVLHDEVGLRRLGR